ncbi:zf-HC2 domain-containing protein [Allosalinactinospora lopnorensis]|uniref:zf-HC2 domain-containing protein n=1 Tax=Allosalinactinospora lopnorensis TaxID=1352348 RepID=UPI0012E0EA80|nr:zf-HC2 domain-containing protein [Allosalinactinospora lopnorensis]
MNDKHSPLMPCSEAIQQLWDYLEGSGRRVDRERVDEHLAFCRRCCGELEFIGHLRDLLASQTIDDSRPQAVQRLERFLEEL